MASSRSAWHEQGFTTPVLLAGGEARAPVHRHPLSTPTKLGRLALLAVTTERDGLYVSMTRIVSFGPAPEELVRVVRAAVEVDARVLAESRPLVTHAGVEVLTRTPELPEIEPVLGPPRAAIVEL